jgi:hypothetical protein
MWIALDKLDSSCDKVGKDTIAQISQMRAEFSLSLMRIERNLAEAKLATVQQHDVSTPPARDASDRQHETLMTLSAMLQRCHSKASDMIVALTILNALTFYGRRQRQAAVSEAYAGTFEWIFQNKFVSWLESSNPIFWISGKPGSGKSTLMKHLVNDPRTTLTLQSWSNPQELFISDYFFWVNGTSLQRSSTGLLRSVLYEILRQNMGIIRDVLPEAWSSVRIYCDASSPLSLPSEFLEWTEKTLLEASQRLSTVQPTGRFCFFVDGLDEYFSEHDKDHDYLLHTLGCLTKAGAKLCVASRPWNVFEEAYGNDLSHKLYLEDLNRGDIQHYVIEKLTTHRNFAGINPTEAEDIVEEIIDKSQGVFLWVRLAVRSLVEGLRNRDSVVLLRRRLREFPDDLNGFFKYMFDSLDPIYRPRLSHMFQIALAADQPLSLIAYWCLDKIEDERDTGPEPYPQPFTCTESLQIVEDMKFRINGRSRGLLETTKAGHTRRERGRHIKDDADPHVDFLHRTVKDYILTTEVQTMLKEWQRGTFNADLTLCKVILMEYKLRVGESGDRIKHLMELFFTAASRAEKTDTASNLLLQAYFEDFEKIVAEHVQSRPHNEMHPWKRMDGCDSLLEVLLKYNMRECFARKIAKRPASQLEKLCCYHTLSTNSEITPTSLDTDSIFEYMILLLSPEHPIKTDTSFLTRVKAQLETLDYPDALQMLIGLSRYDFVDSMTKLDAQFRRGLTQVPTSIQWEELSNYLDDALLLPGGHVLRPSVVSQDKESATAVHKSSTSSAVSVAHLSESVVADGTGLVQHTQPVLQQTWSQWWFANVFCKSK